MLVNIVLWSGLLVLVVIAYLVISFYNRIVRLKNNIEKSWANIGVLLKQRNDELPNLINTVKGYAKHEKTLLNELTRAREGIKDKETVTEQAKESEKMSKNIKTLFARMENYPDLKANENFLKLQKRISELETMIADRREFFNDSVNIYNIRIEQFPFNILANMFSYTKKEMFNTEEQDLKVKF